MSNYPLKSTLCACLVMLPSLAVSNPAIAGDGLWDLLKAGGKVLLMRHAPVEKGPGGGDPLLRDPSCAKEKRLSSQGKREAERVGGRFRDRGIPVTKVLHSPFCRTTATAQLAFGAADPAQYLSLLEILGPEAAMRQTEELTRVIGSYAGEGNLVLVTHEPNISAVSFELLKHLDILVLDPQGGGEFEELGVIRFSDTDSPDRE